MTTDTKDHTDSTAAEGHDLDAGKDAVAEAYDKLMEAKTHFRKALRLRVWSSKTRHWSVCKKGGESLEAVGSQIVSSTQKNPLAALGVAFVVGILFSKVISNR